MIFFGNPTSTPAVHAALDAGLLGCITTPKQYNTVKFETWDVIADNGCFSKRWDAAEWLDWLKRLPPVRFAVCPDVADPEGGSETHAATLERWWTWSPEIRDLGHVPAFVCQPGCRVEDVPEDAEVLFIGGHNEYKLGEHVREICAAYQGERWLHMGRVNSRKRLRIAHEFGCDSVDGTLLTYGPDIYLPKVIAWLEEVNA